MSRLVRTQSPVAKPDTLNYTLDEGSRAVGFFQLRRQPSHSQLVPADFASHIYYEIYPEFRGQGFGQEILRLGLMEAKKIGLNKVIVTSRQSNLASRRIIEKNGGQLLASCSLPDDPDDLLLKYIIRI